MRVRLQFSLRMLFLLMAVIATGLAVFRWPWEETHNGLTTSYRRAWNWKPLKHGLERRMYAGLLEYEKEYVDGVLLRRREFDEPSGKLLVEEFHVPQRSERFARFYGQLEDWGFIVERTEWDDSKQVLEVWKTPGGEVLESYRGKLTDFISDNVNDEYTLIEWNGRPITEEMSRVLSDLRTEKDRIAWMSPHALSRTAPGTPGTKPGDGTDDVLLSQSTDRIPYCPTQRTKSPTILRGYAPEILGYFEVFRIRRIQEGRPPHTEPIFHYLLPLAHRGNCTLRVRFGVLTLEPIGPALLDADDKTGVLAVNFPAGSTQEQAWLEPVVPMRQDIEPDVKRIEQFFAGTSIEVDVSRADLSGAWTSLDDATYLRPRRDALGIFLLANYHRVEQQGKRLILYPR